jgi:hypothetical protein
LFCAVQGKRRDRMHQEHMSELYQDLMIQQQEEDERKRKILLEQEERLAAEILRYVNFLLLFIGSLVVVSLN